jgi:hypothetical protein
MVREEDFDHAVRKGASHGGSGSLDGLRAGQVGGSVREMGTGPSLP